MDQEETWIQLRMEPLDGNEETAAIGTIRDVTQQVKERHRLEEESKLLNRMMQGTMAGLEISLEEDAWRLLWGTTAYQDLFRRAGADQDLQRCGPGGHRPHPPPQGPGAILPGYGALGAAIHLPVREQPFGPGVPGEVGPAPRL